MHVASTLYPRLAAFLDRSDEGAFALEGSPLRAVSDVLLHSSAIEGPVTAQRQLPEAFDARSINLTMRSRFIGYQMKAQREELGTDTVEGQPSPETYKRRMDRVHSPRSPRSMALTLRSRFIRSQIKAQREELSTEGQGPTREDYRRRAVRRSGRCRVRGHEWW